MDNIYTRPHSDQDWQKLSPVSFSELGIKERRDLQEWISKNPTLLGEELFVVATEFGNFDGAARRVDILALDKDGNIVVVELKREAEKTHIELQALRYAAFCSTMKAKQLVRAFAEFATLSDAEAESRILSFLETETVTSLEGQPRIILAAASFSDNEILSTVLWLRRFGINITCVELTPYKNEKTGELILVPRVIIPLPETRDYMVSVLEKERDVQESRPPGFSERLLARIRNLMVDLPGGVQFSAANRKSYLQLLLGMNGIHYEFGVRRQLKCFAVSLHAERGCREENWKLINPIKNKAEEIKEGIEFEFVCENWSSNWVTAEFRLPLPIAGSEEEFARDAVRVMKVLIERTHPLLPKSKLSE
jgi:hypothetical protein